MNSAPSQKQHQAGISIIEVMIAMLLLGICVVGTVSAISFSRTTIAKAREKAIALDFALHYAELVRGLPFEDLSPGSPINGLYDGRSGAPSIRIPTNSSFFSVNTTDYAAFHPELSWFENLNPELRVTLNTAQVGAVDHTKHLNLELRWDSPLARGSKLNVTVDVVRVKDL